MSRSKLIISLGFSIILILIFISSYIAISTLSLSNHQLNKFVTDDYHKIYLVHYLRFTSKERTLQLLRMLSLTDEEEINNSLETIAEHGGLYAKYREEYLLLANSKEEQDLLDIHDIVSNWGGPLHIKIADHIQFGEKEKAMSLISGQLVDMHKSESKVYTQLLDYHLNKGNLAVENNKKNYEELVENLWLFLFFVIFISTCIMLFMMHLIATYDKQQSISKQKLETALTSANQANNAKSELLSNMSHELRTPLHAIMGFTDIISYKKDIDPKLYKYMCRIKDASNHLLALVDDVLDLSKIENGKIKIKIQPTTLQPILKECRELIEPSAIKAHLQLDFDTNVPYTVHADPIRLKQAVLNLLSNAVKYNSEHGEITVSCEVIKNKLVRINIKDTGAGLTEKQKDKIFQPFERLDANSKIYKEQELVYLLHKN